jgi:hypothetical protein
MYTVEVRKSFKALQGLKSPVRASKGLSSLVPENGFDVTMTVGIMFDISQLNERGWFVDTDAIEEEINKYCDYLSSDKWTNLFPHRPTFELVSKLAYEKLQSSIPQLKYVELTNNTIGVTTKYTQ